MTSKSFIFILLLVFIIPIQLNHLFLNLNNNKNDVAGLKTRSFSINNAAFLGEFRFTLFGYTSPLAEVTLNGQGISDQTTADSTGYFEFINRFSPFSPHEACLSSKDQFGRISLPVCLPDFPTQYNVTIGPVIIPPTISLNEPNYYVGDEAILSGQSIPNEEINLSVFTEPQNPFLALFNNPFTVEAYSLPKLSAKTDNKGNFSISLPSNSSQNYRLFTQVNFENNQSPNSLTLRVKILPIWMVIIKFFTFIFNIFKPRLLETTIVIEIIGLLAYFLRVLINPSYLVSRKNSIVLYKPQLPEIAEKHPLVKT